MAAAAAVCVVLAGIRFFDVLSPQYARNVAPMLNGLFEKSAPPQSLTDAPARPEGGRPGGAADARSESADSPLEASESVPVLDLGVRREGPGAAPAYAVSVSRNRKLTGSSNLIGVSPALFQELGLRTNPWLRLVGPAGKTIGVLATEMPNAATPIVLSPEIHDALSHGRTTLSYVKTRPVYWSREGAAAALDFQAPRALDSEYCEYWYSVGLSLPSMLELGLTPGAYAVVHGPEGTQSVRVQLVDRGQSTEVWLSEPVREAVGAGRQDATIRVFPKS